MKAKSQDLFDVTMGSYDGAETCELVGIYILDKLSDIIPKDQIGLYRDDGLSIIHGPPRLAECIKKTLCNKFKDMGLQITACTNSTVIDFLDVTFDLKKREHKPYSKPNNNHLYVHTQSNHPPSIIKQIPYSVQSRLSTISSNEQVFDDAKSEYEAALHIAGHKTNIRYEPNQSSTQTQRKKTRKRNITWFNPPYSQHVQTPIGKKFLQLLDQNFPKQHILHKICNRNTIKLSYSCTDNMSQIIKAHNNKIIGPNSLNDGESCNCRNRQLCPLEGKCTTSNIVYEAQVTSNAEVKTYIGLTATTFKTRYSAHRSSFSDSRKKNSTELSKYIWALKDRQVPYNITWKIIRHATPYTPKTKRCNLCLWEKYHIITADKSMSLNSRTELISTCRHRRKFTLFEYG